MRFHQEAACVRVCETPSGPSSGLWSYSPTCGRSRGAGSGRPHRSSTGSRRRGRAPREGSRHGRPAARRAGDALAQVLAVRARRRRDVVATFATPVDEGAQVRVVPVLLRCRSPQERDRRRHGTDRRFRQRLDAEHRGVAPRRVELVRLVASTGEGRRQSSRSSGRLDPMPGSDRGSRTRKASEIERCVVAGGRRPRGRRRASRARASPTRRAACRLVIFGVRPHEPEPSACE